VQWVLGGIVILVTVALVVGGITGRVRARSCCAVPPEQDLRLRGSGPQADQSHLP